MHLCISSLHSLKSFDTSVIHLSSKHLSQSLPSLLGARSETSREATVRSNLVGNAGSRPISEAKQPWACPVLGWGTTGEAHVLYSFHHNHVPQHSEVRTSTRARVDLAWRHGDTQTGHMDNVGWQWFCFQSGFDSCSAYQIKLEQPKHTSPSTPALILPPLSRHTGPHLAWSQASKSPHPFPITDTLLPPP